MANRKTTKTRSRGKLMDVPLGKLVPSTFSQRGFKEPWARQILADLDLDDLGVITVNFRGGVYYIVDGQHRVWAVKEWLGPGNDEQVIECRVFDDLSEQEEANLYDRLATTLAQTSFQKFITRVRAHREVETQIYNIVQKAELVLSLDDVPGAIGAVGTLRRVYLRSDGSTLFETLSLIRDAYGDPGFEARVIDGIGHLCQRYNGELDRESAVNRLRDAHGGVKGLIGRAERIHQQSGNPKAQCVAAAAVDIINQRRGGKKLPSWWKGA